MVLFNPPILEFRGLREFALDTFFPNSKALHQLWFLGAQNTLPYTPTCCPSIIYHGWEKSLGIAAQGEPVHRY